jgi:hypothetical protein
MENFTMPGTAHTDPFGLQISPAKVMVAAGQHHYAEKVTVTDIGSKPLKMTTAPALLDYTPRGCTSSSTGAQWGKISDTAFTLQPGASHEVTFSVTAPSGATGQHTVEAVFTGTSAAVAGSHSGGAVNGSVGSEVVMNLSGHAPVPVCASAPPAAPRAAPPSGGGSALGGAVIAVIALAAVLLALWGYALRRRRRAS